jgi:hypothetical protein
VGIDMVEFENSRIIKHVLDKLINITSRKTDTGQAVSIIFKSIKELQNKYDFLKNIEIKDTQFIELEEPISVMSDIDNIRSDEIGKALYDIIKSINSTLGRNAGYFLIKELKNSIDDEFNTSIIDMGLDLSLMQLEFEINEMTKKL